MLYVHQFSSVTQSCLTLLWPHGLQHTRLPITITNSRSSLKLMSIESVMPSNHAILCCPVFSGLRSFPASGSFPMSQLFTSGGQSIGVSASASVILMNVQDWFPLRWTGWIFLQSKGLSRIFSNSTVHNHQFFGTQPSLWSQLTHPYVTTGKNIALTRQIIVGKVMSLFFNMLSRFSSKEQVSFNFMAAVAICSDFVEAQKNKVCHCFHCFPIYLPWSDGTGCQKRS